MEEMIRTEGLCKYYGPVKAVKGVTLSVRQGEIYGFLGLNGAGKTTTIRMLLGMVRPSAGAAFLKGQRVHQDNPGLWNSIGYLVETPYAYPELTVRQNLEMTAALRLIQNPNAPGAIMDVLNISQYENRKACHLSLGNQQRLGLAKAMIHQPEILVLDEPSNGLDPAGIVEIRGLLKEMASKQGRTIFVSSHNLDEVSRFADRIGIIHEGRLIVELDMDEVARLTERKLQIVVKNPAAAAHLLIRKGYQTSVDGTIMTVIGSDALSNPENVNELLVHGGFSPSALGIVEENLESYFLRVIGHEGVNK